MELTEMQHDQKTGTVYIIFKTTIPDLRNLRNQINKELFICNDVGLENGSEINIQLTETALKTAVVTQQKPNFLYFSKLTREALMELKEEEEYQGAFIKMQDDNVREIFHKNYISNPATLLQILERRGMCQIIWKNKGTKRRIIDCFSLNF
jgi:hypothetical protein